MKKLSIDYTLMHYKWLANNIVEAKKGAKWVNGVAIYKNTLRFTTNTLYSIVKHYITLIEIIAY